MTRGFISWLGLWTHDPFGPVGKLASIWFDQLVLQIPAPSDFEDMVDKAGDQAGMSEACRESLLRFWRPAEKELPGCDWSLNPWDSVKDERLKELATEARMEQLRDRYPGINENEYPFWHGVAMGAAGLIQTLSAWGALNAQTACTMIPNELEAKTLSAMLNAESSGPFDGFRALAERRVPDLASMSWERVIELREHPFLQAFRKKLDDLQLELRREGVKGLRDTIEELERRDLVEIAKLSRPAPLSATWKAIGSNVPLPIPVNPLSIGLAIKEIKEAYERRSRFGWLYFLIDFEEKARAQQITALDFHSAALRENQ